ncbi:FecR domain-containing protein [Chitinophaga sp. 212800010-3]|uniref:FecR family protein n=1 Tax=unclassified Chitinophaga TaxID=2619133 RepID=UPI002DF43365|nr:FecR domain-containing protein [Chitinophaga sp. 212800010-3]
MSAPEQFQQLMDKYLTNTITTHEKRQLFGMIREGIYLPQLEEMMEEAWEEPAEDGEDLALREQIFEQIKEHQGKVRRWRVWRRTAAAAAVLLLMVAAGYIFLFRTESVHGPASLAAIQPGSSKAVLVLADNSQLTLDSGGHRVLNQGAAVVSQQEGQLVYTAGDPLTDVSYNTLQTGRGGQFSLVLPDGTKVWVNAASSVRYPTVFPDKERRIDVTGEVYLEVKQDARPFVVSTPYEMLQVLGTKFNINAYEDEAATLTTLLSGKVKVENRNAVAVILQPGQESEVAHKPSAVIPVRAADTEQAIAWKNGYFNFDNERLDVILRLLSRWYDMKFEADDAVAALRFSAIMERSSSLENVLSALSATGAVEFSLKNNRIKARLAK